MGKDGDLNTAFGNSVSPLPFHAMKSYTYPKDEKYPKSKEHLEYMQKYDTRWVDSDPYRNALKVSVDNKKQ